MQLSDPMKARGVDGRVLFDGQHLTIERSRMTSQEKVRIPISAVDAVGWTPAGLTSHGTITFTIPGQGDDFHRVSFRRHRQATFKQLRDQVQEARWQDAKKPPAGRGGRGVGIFLGLVAVAMAQTGDIHKAIEVVRSIDVGGKTLEELAVEVDAAMTELAWPASTR
jgi:hypothetical protein